MVGHFDRLIGRASRLRLGYRNLIRLQERLRQVFGQYLAAFGEDRIEDAPQPLAVEQELQWNVFRRLVQDFEIAGVGNQVHERADRLLGRVVRGDSGVVEYLDAFGDHASAHPGGQHGLVSMARRLAYGLRSSRRIGHRLRRKNHQHRVDVLVFEHNLHGLGEPIGRGVAQHVDRVAVRPTHRQELVELRHRFVGNRGQFAVAGNQGVGRHHAGAAGVGDDRQAVALGRLLAGQQLGAVEHVFDLEDSLDARPLKCRLVDRVDAGHGAGVRCRRLRRFRESTGLVGHDRLRSRERAGRRHELAGFADRLDVQDDRAGFGGRAEIVDQVAHAHVEHVAHRNEIREPDAFVQRPIEHRRAERAGLRNETDVSLGGRSGGKTGVQADSRHNDAQTVRAKNPHAVELSLLRSNQGFELPAFGADLAEPRRDNHQPPGSRFSALPNQGGHRGGGRANHRQIRRVRQAGNVLVGLDPLDRLALRVDRINHPSKARSNQIPQYGVSNARRRVAGADDGNSMRVKYLIEIPNAQDLLLNGAVQCGIETVKTGQQPIIRQTTHHSVLAAIAKGLGIALLAR